MIVYDRGGVHHLLNLFKLRGSLFPVSFLVALPATGFAAILKVSNLATPNSVFSDQSAWSGFSFLVGFLVVFRTSQAYARFWDGCSATHRMQAEWTDAACALASFCKASAAPVEDVVKFKHLVVRLFSLLHTLALAEIEDSQDWDRVMASKLELIDPNGLDRESWVALTKCENKVGLVFQWIQNTIVCNIHTGVLAIPPPILSRVFQELANGMVRFHEAAQIASIPFPFPYAQVCDALLAIHWMSTPLVTAQSTNKVVWAAVLTFIQVFIMQALNNIAVEIEHPFGADDNDLNTSAMQVRLNMSLLLLLHPYADRVPELSSEAVVQGLVCQGRRASHNLAEATRDARNTDKRSTILGKLQHEGWTSKNFWKVDTNSAGTSVDGISSVKENLSDAPSKQSSLSDNSPSSVRNFLHRQATSESFTHDLLVTSSSAPTSAKAAQVAACQPEVDLERCNTIQEEKPAYRVSQPFLRSIPSNDNVRFLNELHLTASGLWLPSDEPSDEFGEGLLGDSGIRRGLACKHEPPGAGTHEATKSGARCSPTSGTHEATKSGARCSPTSGTHETSKSGASGSVASTVSGGRATDTSDSPCSIE